MPAKLIRSLYNIAPSQQGAVVTIGNFDGVHLGHQHLVKRVIAEANRRARPSMVITFEPHPIEFFAKDTPHIPRITRLREKFLALVACGVDNVLILPFNQSFAEITASKFITDILYGSLQVSHIIVGEDFHFGFKRQGNVQLLASMGSARGFTVETMPNVMIDGKRISSTLVRQALTEGKLKLASRLLGHPYSMLGRVSHGDKLGKRLGFPTANIWLHRQLAPLQGIYTIYMHGLAGKPLPGVAYIGTRPSVDGCQCLLEVHLLDFNKNIYGWYVSVEFCKKLRDDAYYPNMDDLQQQIAKDVIAARHYFKDQGVL